MAFFWGWLPFPPHIAQGSTQCQQTVHTRDLFSFSGTRDSTGGGRAHCVSPYALLCTVRKCTPFSSKLTARWKLRARRTNQPPLSHGVILPSTRGCGRGSVITWVVQRAPSFHRTVILGLSVVQKESAPWPRPPARTGALRDRRVSPVENNADDKGGTEEEVPGVSSAVCTGNRDTAAAYDKVVWAENTVIQGGRLRTLSICVPLLCCRLLTCRNVLLSLSVPFGGLRTKAQRGLYTSATVSTFRHSYNK